MQMFFWLVIQSFPNKFSWERNEWQSPKNVNVVWERRLSFPHIFYYSHALCPLTHAGYSLNVKKIILLPFETTFAGAKRKPEKIQACIYDFPPFATIMLFLYLVFEVFFIEY